MTAGYLDPVDLPSDRDPGDGNPGDGNPGDGEPTAPAPLADLAAGHLASTGHPAVDAALGEVVRLAEASPAAQVPALQAAHRVFRETLASIDEQ